MENNVRIQAAEVTRLLQSDPASATAGFVEFAMEYATDNHQLHRALVLKLNYSSATDPRHRQQLVKEMEGLIESISDLPMAELPVQIEQEEQNRSVKITPKVVCETEGITKTFKKSGFNLANIAVSFSLGEITGVVGENGNGKTTLFRILVGELASDGGSIHYPYIQQQLHNQKFDWGAIKQHIAFISQDIPKWFGSVRDNLHYELAIHGIKGQENDDEVDYIIYRLGLEEHQNKSWSQLSGGYKLRFALARALVWKPQFLVIDEPLANLDIKAQLVILNDLRDLANSYRYPLSIVISSQHLHEIENVSDNIIFLRQGEVVYYGKTNELGKERDENTFEFKTTLSLEEIEKRLAGLEYYHIENTGQEYIISTPLDVTYNELLAKFLAAGIEIEYFRNISQSTKKLFV